MNYSSDHLNVLSKTNVALAGATSGFVTRTVIQPFDVLKIRFQLQVEPIAKMHTASKYNSMRQAIALIYKEEGVFAFWKGIIPAQMLSVSFGLLQFWSFEMLRHEAKSMGWYQNHRASTNFLAGALAGCVATYGSFPFDILRTRLVAQSDYQRLYKGSWDGCKHILQNEGVLGFYKGVTPTLLAVAPNAGCQFMFYHFFGKFYRLFVKIDSNSYNIMGNMFAGSMAGFFSKMLLYPLDLIRKRMQIQGFDEARKHFGETFHCGSMSHCISKTIRKEGVLGLFKGMAPSLLKALLASAFNFTTFEVVCKMMYLYKL